MTGAGGFVGHHALEHLLSTTDWHVIATDSFRHRGATDRIAQVLAPHPEWRSRL
jgi:nucleoside-diphosphate-sugar epimerase